MTYSEVVALLTSSVHGVRKAVYGVQVREYIARSMEAVIEMVRLGIERMKELASDSKNSADASAKSAAESKQSAAESKASASQSEASANRSEASADASAKSASESAASAAAAKKSETNAKSSEDSAKRYSDKAKNVIAEAKSEYSGGYYKSYDLTALKGGWNKLSPAKGPYQYYCDIAVPDLTERHSPFCSTGLESYAAAVAAGLANAVETRNGALRLFAIRVPTKDIELVLTIFGVGTTSYELTLPVRDWVKMESAIGPNQYYCDVEVPGCLSTMTPLGDHRSRELRGGFSGRAGQHDRDLRWSCALLCRAEADGEHRRHRSAHQEGRAGQHPCYPGQAGSGQDRRWHGRDQRRQHLDESCDRQRV